MTIWKSFAALAVAAAFAGSPLTAFAEDPKPAEVAAASEDKKSEEHGHKHGPKCGHKAEKHADHTDYEHDGHHHKKHKDHFDECDGPEADAAKAGAHKPDAAKVAKPEAAH